MNKQVKFKPLNIKNKYLSDVNSMSNIPKIFIKKKNKITIKFLKYINNDMGKTRHYPPAAQE